MSTTSPTAFRGRPQRHPTLLAAGRERQGLRWARHGGGRHERGPAVESGRETVVGPVALRALAAGALALGSMALDALVIGHPGAAGGGPGRPADRGVARLEVDELVVRRVSGLQSSAATGEGGT